MTPLLAIILANTWWGLSPLYWHELSALPPLFVLAVRVVASRLVLQFIPLEPHQREGSEVVKAPTLKVCLATSVLISINWGLYIVAVLNGHTVQASLGYFLLPIVSVVFAAYWFKENLKQSDWIAFVIACAGVLIVALKGEGVPYIAIGLAASMLLYTAIYKSHKCNPLYGLRMETTILTFVAFPYILYCWSDLSHLITTPILILLFGSGLVTALPLYFFLSAVRQIDFASVGFLQFIIPIIKLLVAVIILGETLSTIDMVSFSLIVFAVVIYCSGRYWKRRSLRRPFVPAHFSCPRDLAD